MWYGAHLGKSFRSASLAFCSRRICRHGLSAVWRGMGDYDFVATVGTVGCGVGCVVSGLLFAQRIEQHIDSDARGVFADISGAIAWSIAFQCAADVVGGEHDNEAAIYFDAFE